MHRLLTPWLLLASAIALLACVTINVYFPAAAAEEAADRIIRQVQDQAPPAEGVREGDAQSAADRPIHPLQVLAALLLESLVPPAQAQQPDIDISTPAIRALVSSMKARFRDLRPYYQSGAIGLTRQATVEIRDRNAVPLAERARLAKLVADENADRNALYAEIAKANGHPEWEEDIRRTFAERWIANADSGWYYMSAAGQWVQKS